MCRSVAARVLAGVHPTLSPQLENQPAPGTGVIFGTGSDSLPVRFEYPGQYQGQGYQSYPVSEQETGNSDMAEKPGKPSRDHFDIGRNNRPSGYRSRPSEAQPSAPSEQDILPGATPRDCSPGVHMANPGEDLSDTFAAKVNMDTRASETSRSQNPPVSDTRPIYQGPPPRYDEKFPDRTRDSPGDDSDLRVLLERVTMETATGDALVALVTWTYQKASLGENNLQVDLILLFDTLLHLIENETCLHNTLVALCNLLHMNGVLRTAIRTHAPCERLSRRLIKVLEQEASGATAGVCARAIQNLTYVGTDNVEWFGTCQKKKKSKSKAKIPGVSPDRVVECLCDSSAVDVYTQCLTENSDPEVIEPVLGIIQNLAAGTSQETRQFQASVRKAKMLPMLVDLLAEQENVKRGALAAMLNLGSDERNRELLAKYAMWDVVKILSLDGTDCPSTPTTCVTLALLWELFYDPRISRNGIDDDVSVLERVGNLAANTEQPINVRQYASEVLQRLWSHKELHATCKRKGLTKDKLYSNLAKHGLDMQQLARDVPVYSSSDPQPSCPQPPRVAPSRGNAMNDYHDNLSRDETYEPPPAYEDVV